MSSGSKGSSGGPPERLLDATGLDAAHRARRLAFFELGPDDDAALRSLRGMAEDTVDQVVVEFYQHLLRFPDLAAILRADPGQLDRLQQLQRAYFLELTDATHDARYFESRLRVGDTHQRIDLRPEWYIGAFSLYLRLALRRLVEREGDGTRVLPQFEALVKAVFLDMSLAMDTYIFGGFVDRHVAAELERAARVAQEALEARAEVEQLKDDLTSMVVHDLKNPVNGIAMMVQLALRKGADLPDTQKNYLQQIDRTCREMMRLIQNLLEIAKIEEGKMPVAREAIVLAEVVDEMLRDYGPVADQAGRSLHVAVGTELPSALGDRMLLKRVLVNLVVNALRHSGSKDVHVQGVAGPAANEVTLSVIDHGHGLQDVERVFEKFRTVRRSAADDPSADTGLGLPFCKLAVERMGGRIDLRSEPGVETAFHVILPAGG